MKIVNKKVLNMVCHLVSFLLSNGITAKNIIDVIWKPGFKIVRLSNTLKIQREIALLQSAWTNAFDGISTATSLCAHDGWNAPIKIWAKQVSELTEQGAPAKCAKLSVKHLNIRLCLVSA